MLLKSPARLQATFSVEAFFLQDGKPLFRRNRRLHQEELSHPHTTLQGREQATWVPMTIAISYLFCKIEVSSMELNTGITAF